MCRRTGRASRRRPRAQRSSASWPRCWRSSFAARQLSRSRSTAFLLPPRRPPASPLPSRPVTRPQGPPGAPVPSYHLYLFYHFGTLRVSDASQQLSHGSLPGWHILKGPPPGQRQSRGIPFPLFYIHLCEPTFCIVSPVKCSVSQIKVHIWLAGADARRRPRRGRCRRGGRSGSRCLPPACRSRRRRGRPPAAPRAPPRSPQVIPPILGLGQLPPVACPVVASNLHHIMQLLPLVAPMQL